MIRAPRLCVHSRLGAFTRDNPGEGPTLNPQMSRGKCCCGNWCISAILLHVCRNYYGSVTFLRFGW